MNTMLPPADRSKPGKESARAPLSSSRISIPALTLGAAVLAAVWLFPFVFVVLTAVRSQGDLLSQGPFSIPNEWSFSNFTEAWEIGGFSVYFRNSLFVTALKVPLGVFIASLAAYSLAKLQFRFRSHVFLFFLLGLAIPIQVALLPLVILMRALGLINTLWALFPPYIAFGLPLHIFILRGFFRGIPDELRDAARLDGASEWEIYWRIMIPLSTPALATVFVIDTLATWNEFQVALVMLSSAAVRTVPLGLQNFQGQYSSNYPGLTAGILIAILPVLIVYVVFQRYLVSGLTAGALKE
jgi:raffinose/stachyose/melibiose transport system permease protein